MISKGSGCVRVPNVNSDINYNYDHIKNTYIQCSQTESSGKDCFEPISVNKCGKQKHRDKRFTSYLNQSELNSIRTKKPETIFQVK